MTDKLLKRLGVEINSKTLSHALTHRSYAYEHGGIPHNERFEFLGDSVLSLVVTDKLFHTYPDVSEGELAKRRSAVVSTHALAQIARELGLGEFIQLGKGEDQTNGRDKSSILADTMEAIIGACYLDQGLDTARDMVLRITSPLIENTEHLKASLDWKTSIQELVAAKNKGEVSYEVEAEGPDHAKLYTAYLIVENKRIASGTGTSKKEAEKVAAKEAWRKLSEK
ncbi:MAG: ribonuclease III [Micrococcaceae bacterium]